MRPLGRGRSRAGSCACHRPVPGGACVRHACRVSSGLRRHLHYVERVVDHRGVCDSASDTVGVTDRVQMRMYSTSMPPEAKIFTRSNPLRSSSQRTSRIRSKKSPRRLPGVSIRIAEIESILLWRPVAHRISRRRRCNDNGAWHLRFYHFVESTGRLGGRAEDQDQGVGVVPVAGMPRRSTARSTATISQPPR